jgi:hypothetical protein
MYGANPGSFSSSSRAAAATSRFSGRPVPAGGTVKSPKRKPPIGGKYVVSGDAEPASGNDGVWSDFLFERPPGLVDSPETPSRKKRAPCDHVR